MKKIIFSLSLIFCIAVAATAQDDNRPVGTLTKGGQNILPAAGDFAIGIDATPFLEYGGKILSDAGASAPGFSGHDVSIFGKYFLSDASAVRVKLGFNGSNLFRNDVFSYVVPNDEAIANNPLFPDATTLDVLTYKNRNVSLNLGYELRRGYGRLQGFYGAGVILGIAQTGNSYTYGNPMTEANPAPTTQWGNQAVRTLNTKSGLAFAAGVNAFVGVEYFVLPKISLGGELGLEIAGVSQGLGKTTTEQIIDGKLVEKTSRTGSAENFYIQTLPTGNIFVAFHF